MKISNCKKCGEIISEDQYKNFNGLCPSCKRISGASSKDSGKSLLFWGAIISLVGVILIGFGPSWGTFPTLNIGIIVIAIIGGSVTLAFGLLIVYFGWKKLKDN